MMIQDFLLALSFFTRTPLGKTRDFGDRTLAQVAWAFPLVGALIGALMAGVYLLLLYFGVAHNPSAWLTIGFSVLLTGGLHEDGLADMADGLAMGRDRQQKLAIMRDSRIGSYGALALVIMLAVRANAMASFGYETYTIWVFIGVSAASRTCLVVMMHLLPPARTDGLFANAGKPSCTHTLIAITITALLLVGTVHSIILSVLALAALFAIIARISRIHFGGLTGDILGALQQLSEVLLLVLFSATLYPHRFT